MTGYNRVSGIRWPVTFVIEDGRRFTVPMPAEGDDPELELLVDDGRGAGRYAIGPSLGEQTTGAIIGRALRWWTETTGQFAVIDRPPVIGVRS